MKKMAFLVCVLAVLGNSAVGAETGKKVDEMKKHPVLTSEQRTQMADAHEKMAACLRSDRLIDDCHKEMMKTCKSVAGKENCPMMGGMMGKGKHHHMMDEKK